MLQICIVEQPALYHRFRYETEIAGGKLGGLLYGRAGSKSCVRLCLKGVDPSEHRTVIVIGGTVNPDGYPHPFYMHGDSCESGAYHWRRDITAADAKKSEFDICLEKVSLVCVSQGGDKLQQAMKKRESINFNPFSKDVADIKYTSKNVRELRLVFQVFYVDKFGVTVPCKSAVVQTDIISDIKFQAKLEIEEIHPNESYLYAKEQVVWIYFKDQLPHSDLSQYSSFLDSSDGVPMVQCEIRSVKKQLMTVCIPRLTSESGAVERLRCSLRVNDLKSDVTAEHDFMVNNYCHHCNSQLLHFHESATSAADQPPSKRNRASNGKSAAPSSTKAARAETSESEPAAAAAAAGRGGSGDAALSLAAEPEEDMLVSVVSKPSASSAASGTTFVKLEEI